MRGVGQQLVATKNASGVVHGVDDDNAGRHKILPVVRQTTKNMISKKELDDAAAKYLGLWADVDDLVKQAQDAESDYAEKLDEYNEASAVPSNSKAEPSGTRDVNREAELPTPPRIGSGDWLGALDLRHTDCMAMMKETPDKSYDLAIVDPPYGLRDKMMAGAGNNKMAKHYKTKKWDALPPTPEYFAELFRVSKNQIIWGYNYFTLPPCRCFIFWDKVYAAPTYADGELAWTSFDACAKRVKIAYAGFIGMDGEKIHPTQKPIALYEWLLEKYAQPGWRILDTHSGSGSSAIACIRRGYNLTACEIDKEYYDQSLERIKRETRQLLLT
jgi:site-specific DNA-methyltransferase (adenine-specific)